MDRVGGAGGGFYGTLPQYIAHAITSFSSGRSWHDVEEFSVENIERRHLICYFLMLVTGAVLFVTVTILSGRPALGLAMVAVLMSTPVFLGGI